MKKSLPLALALGLASVSQLMAVDVYITGSTAFRTQVYTACTKMFSGGIPSSISYGDAPHGGDGTITSGNTAWVMTGTAGSSLNFSGTAMTIHGLFTGSVSGIATTEAGTPLTFPLSGPNGALATAYTTNTATVGFSDSASEASPAYDTTYFPNFGEEQVAVQPFVICKSLASSGKVTGITNVTWGQLRSIMPNGRLPYSAWSGNVSDTNSFIYLANRTTDSGTRVTTYAEMQYAYGAPAKVYLFDNQSTTRGFYLATNSLFATAGTNGFGVIGSTAGNNNANILWGSGYIGGGDLRTGLKYADPANQAIGYLSVADAKSAGTAGNYWGSVIAFNGVWPTAAGSGINGNTGTNDFSPICLGKYPIWGYEVVVYPLVDPVNGGISQANLGDQQTPGTFLGVLDSQTLYNGGSPIIGSIEEEIELSKTGSPGATAIRLSDMQATRGTVGGTIQVTPYVY